MKESEKTKNISIASILTILAIIIVLFSFKKPKYSYTQNTANTLEQITNTDSYLISENDIKKDSKIIDVRDKFEFAKGAIKGAINLPSAELLNYKNENFLDKLKNNHTQIVLYAKTPEKTLPVFMLLKQLGFEKIFILKCKVKFLNNQLVVAPTEIEKPITNVTAFISKNRKPEEKTKQISSNTTSVKKKVKRKQKKRKTVVEGGC